MAAPAAKRQRTEPTSAPLFFIPIDLLGAILGGMGLATSPPLPISFQPFRFLVYADLSSIGVNLCAIPFNFGWELNLWIFDGELGEKIAHAPSELLDRVVAMDSESSLSDDDSDAMHVTGWELVEYVGSVHVDESGNEVESGPPESEIEMQTRAEPMLEPETEAETLPEPPVVPETGEGTRSEPVFVPETEDETVSENPIEVEKMADPVIQDFSKPFPVSDFLDEFAEEFAQEAKTSVEAESSLPEKVVDEVPKKKRFKQLAGKIDFSKLSTPKTTPRPSRKSSRLAFRSRPQASKLSGGSKQEPVLVKDTDSSPNTSPVRESVAPPEEQAPAKTEPDSSLPSPKSSPKTEISKPSFKTPSSTHGTNRKISPKQVSKQGPAVPSSKRTRKLAPSAPSPKLAQFSKRSVVRVKL